MTRSKIRTSGAEGLTLSSTSLTVANGLTLTDGNVTMASGHGMDFAVTTNSSGSMNSELFNDYENGTWTPTLLNGGSATNNYASYVKIGDLVTAYAYISAASIPDNGSQFQIGGLPFSAHSNSNYYAGGSLSYSGGFNTNNFTDPLVVYGGTYLYFHRNDGTSSSIANSNLTGATRYLIFQVTYHTQIS